ncbi:RecQ-mediated genome instability protein 1 [Labeo rohita]|uniref:RecQ-mediated genome instability protein 1 n=1 Tax=Labeo rohita TaxID=84645 RepID=A0ABQ8L2Y8_LABRO|nr:RecQ-mediated genome instability protein 1 [Labeo rohita]
MNSALSTFNTMTEVSLGIEPPIAPWVLEQWLPTSLADLTHYPDDCLCTFYKVSLNTTTQAKLSGYGPRRSFDDYVVLVSCGPPITTKEVTSPTPDSEPSPTSPWCTEHQPEPTTD